MDNASFTQSGPVSGPHQFAMLDFFVPGFSTFSSAVQAYLGMDLNLYIPLLMIVCGSMWSWGFVSAYFHSAVEKHLMSSVRIRTDDEIFNMVMAWVTQQSFSQRSRKFMANTNINSRSYRLWYCWDDDDDDDDYEQRSRRNNKKKELQYTPSYGTHFFWYKGRPCFFDRLENGENPGSFLASEKEELSISCFGRNPEILKSLLHDAREQFLQKDEHKTLIYRGAFPASEDPDWQRCMARSSRPFSTVILNEKTKQGLIDDVADYLHPTTRRWYANRGIPYRRGYLLHGPPGTGKSSLSLALAGFFNMRIYILSLSSPSATEENVSSLFSSLPRKCVILLEDIDTAGLTHTREIDPASLSESSPIATEKKAPDLLTANRMSLSGLLNILDGVASQEGRVLIMTTNHIENLDKALIRPGRVDMIIPFGQADAGMTAAIFRAIYAPYEGEETPTYGSNGSTKGAESDGTGDKRATAIERVDELSQKFSAKIPEHEFSPAEIQGLLLRHKFDPLAAIESSEDWVEQTRKDKAEKEVRDAEERRKKVEEAKKKAEKEKRKEKRSAKKKKVEKKKKGSKDEEESDEEESNGDNSSDSSSNRESDKDENENEAEEEKVVDGKGEVKKAPSNSGYETSTFS